MYYSNRDVRLEQMDVPEPGPGELLLRVQASGICGSDVMEWYRRHKVPLVLGHEVSGVVERTAPDVTTFRPGDRVAVSHHVPCNTCRLCLAGRHTACETLRTTSFDPGGFAEFVRVPAIDVDRGVDPLPEEVSFDEGTFAEPLACVLRAQKKMKIEPGQTVFVLGAGISGLLHVALARALGAGRIVASDLSAWRREAAIRFGADEAVDGATDVTEKMLAAAGCRADAVVVATGAVPALEAAFNLVERGGAVLIFAPTDEGVRVPLDVNDLFWRTEVTLTTSYAGAPADHVDALALIRAKAVPVAEMITHRFGLADAQKGFALVEKGDDSIKVIVEPFK